MEVPGELQGSIDRLREETRKLIEVMEGSMKRSEIQLKLGLRNDDNFRIQYLNHALEDGFIEMTHPDRPNHPSQKYRLTEKGRQFKKGMQ